MSNISIAFGGEQVLEQAHHPGHVFAAGQVGYVEKFGKDSHSEELRNRLHLKIFVVKELNTKQVPGSVRQCFSTSVPRTHAVCHNYLKVVPKI